MIDSENNNEEIDNEDNNDRNNMKEIKTSELFLILEKNNRNFIVI